MTTLVLTVVGTDRAGLVAALADVVDAHGGNWEDSRLTELAGAFAGVVRVSVAAGRADELEGALAGLAGLQTLSVRGAEDDTDAAAPARRLSLTVLGNDRPGIVREIATALSRHGVSIEEIATQTRDAAMYGGRLFEATLVAGAPASADLDAVIAELEGIAAEIQVDIGVD